VNNAATNILVGIVIAGVSSWITVQLSLRRFRSEKLWERKVAAYERVIEALHHSKAFCAAHMTAEEEGREVAAARDQALRQRATEADMEIQKASDVGGFLLSDEAQARLEQYAKESKEASNSPDWYGYLEADFAATDSCLTDLIRIAKKDLQAR